MRIPHRPNLDAFVIFMPEFNAGSLMSVQKLIPGTKFNDKQIWIISWQIIKGMVALNENNIIHYDLKHENILVHIPDIKSKNVEKTIWEWTGDEIIPQVVVADYGESKFQTKVKSEKYEMIGTIVFMAPE